MDAKNLPVYNSPNPQVVKDPHTIFPRVSITVLAHCFVIEAIHSCDLACLVVPSQQRDEVGVFQLEAEQEL